MPVPRQVRVPQAIRRDRRRRGRSAVTASANLDSARLMRGIGRYCFVRVQAPSASITSTAGPSLKGTTPS